jgi:hypothetical protein
MPLHRLYWRQRAPALCRTGDRVTQIHRIAMIVSDSVELAAIQLLQLDGWGAALVPNFRDFERNSAGKQRQIQP